MSLFDHDVGDPPSCLSAYVKSLGSASKARYFGKLTVPRNGVFLRLAEPNSIPDDQWVDDPSFGLKFSLWTLLLTF